MNNANAVNKNKSIAIDHCAGKYLIFPEAGEEYGVEIIKVQDMIGLMPMTPVPLKSKYMRGVINLRGKIHPIMDFKVKFGLEKIVINDETCIIIPRNKTKITDGSNNR
ncbi:MAG: chemotaxis protein CheW [Smithella sp.]|jgi:purine-binding chemotaxis protein CheW